MNFGFRFGFGSGSSLPITVLPTAYFNGVFTPSQITAEGGTYTGGPTVFADNLGALQTAPSGMPALQGMRFTGGAYFDTTSTGLPLLPSVNQPTRTSVTVLDGSELGPELITVAADREFSSDTGFWSKGSGWSIVGGVAERSVAGSSSIERLTDGAGTSIGKVYTVRYTVTRTSGTVYARVRGTYGAGRNSSGTFTEQITAGKGSSLEFLASNFAGSIDNVSVKEVLPAFTNVFTPSTTYKKYTRTNPAVDLPGYLCEPARTNYALNSAAPATHTTGTIPVGTYTLWQDGTGSITATAGTAVGTFGAASNGTPATITITTAGTVVLTASGTNTWVQLELGAFKTSRITTASAAVTRQGTVLSFPTLGKIRNNDIALKLSAVPRGAGQSGYLWGSYTNASNFTYLSIGPYDITFKSAVNGFSQDLAIASYTHKADTPFEVILCKSSKGAQLLVREYSGGTWQPWVRGGFSVTSSNLVVGGTYTLGAFNNAGQFAGNVSELDSLLIPVGIANPVAWVESQWGVTGAGSNPVIFNHTFTGLTLLDGVLRTKSASDSVTINWGDGTSNTYSGTADTAFTHTYASSTTVYNVTYTASDNSVLTKIAYTDRAGGKVGGGLSLPAGMTYFFCVGINTLSGALSLPASMTYFLCTGSNTLSGYTPSTKASNQNRFYLGGLNTLSAANVDAIIQDYAAAGGTWTGDKVFSMTVLTASNRTAASDAAWATLGTKGLVTRTITLR